MPVQSVLTQSDFFNGLREMSLYLHLMLAFGNCHYENTPIQYTVIFHGRKNDYFQMKKCDIFLIFAQNIDCGYH